MLRKVAKKCKLLNLLRVTNMAKGNYSQRKEKKKVKKSTKRNGKITTSRALYDNQLVGANPSPMRTGY